MSDYSQDDLAHIRNKKIGFIFQSFQSFKENNSF